MTGVTPGILGRGRERVKPEGGRLEVLRAGTMGVGLLDSELRFSKALEFC
ncbi:hypothetical protein GPL15_03390 [Clostridium sp. MCC353]|nr:hypothetical protein [Clostridium sp. MCC353]MBT9775553.1 hypothetical protein [Clostridium sp. MCC353]